LEEASGVLLKAASTVPNIKFTVQKGINEKSVMWNFEIGNIKTAAAARN
jgi:hypothetical protein